MKISFNPDRTKTSIYLNNATLEQTPVQKHLGINLASKLSFTEHINEKINKAKEVLASCVHYNLFYHISTFLLIIYLS